ncbi:LON peptidase substrate-binding domain-containing protein [Pseudomonas sp. N040]|uniref:LON peptidase substrate-binding domain-containing protein n=1 Tax=Pseudomonas sp. N040 TaxID=2785325 RepID=UPI0018A267F0|nr:LON peptidase substrate-binding domain-containing protein [Pseudomonas sp. N040]MBF7730154.1 LON peptidase substrate-binding domain-containing protein [Pseudomonas sp. N040]MBW7013796.1 LON peptidase substrate-binding domain-containing protein [Pseudomonas sp. N040]
MSLPLFPLSTVLFPGCQLDLQLFEARYLDMLGRCMKQGSGFGIVGILEGQEVGMPASQIALVGCEALIRDWQQRPNGLLGIRVEGGRRFRVNSSWVQPDQLTCADVEWLDEAPDLPLLGEHADLAALLQVLAEHPLVDNLGMSGNASSQQALANQLAYLLPFSIEEKTALLELRSPAQRLAQIQLLLEQLQGTLSA